MKRIPSPLLLAALPLLAPLLAPHSGVSAGDPLSGQRGFTQDGSQTGTEGDDGTEDEEGAEEDDRPDGIRTGDPETFDVFGRRTRTRASTFEERLQGGWRLVRMDLRGSNPRNRVAQGFMHLDAHFITMELHALWESDGASDFPENDIHTTFTAEYQLDSSGKLYCSTIIGSYIDEETGELRWERGGYEREYTVREIRNQIELSFREDGIGESRLYFAPYIPRGAGERNIFGKQEVGSFGGTDIFGRKTANRNSNRDIYGRPIPPAEGEPGPDDKKGIPDGPGAGGTKGNGTPLSRRGG
ncbi:MAG: hypothetical protein AAGG01_10560 [Planctomycetota bacterium]